MRNKRTKWNKISSITEKYHRLKIRNVRSPEIVMLSLWVASGNDLLDSSGRVDHVDESFPMLLLVLKCGWCVRCRWQWQWPGVAHCCVAATRRGCLHVILEGVIDVNRGACQIGPQRHAAHVALKTVAHEEHLVNGECQLALLLDIRGRGGQALK